MVREDPLADAWSAGSYEEIAPQYFEMAGQLVATAPIQGDTEVLDIGCGTGIVAIAAAREDAAVTGVDISLELLERAQENAAVAGQPDIEWYEADATDLPFGADQFAVTLSNLGHMYADPPTKAVEELVRVTEPGGHVGFTAWTPSSVYPTMTQMFLPYLSPEDLPDIGEPPFLWGDPDTVRNRLEPAVTELQFETRSVDYPAMSPGHFREETISLSGVFSALAARVESHRREELDSEVEHVIHRAFDPVTNTVELEYLQAMGRVNA